MNPDDEAVRRGYEAYMDGASVNANPFMGLYLRRMWRRGWDWARKEVAQYEKEFRKLMKGKGVS